MLVGGSYEQEVNKISLEENKFSLVVGVPIWQNASEQKRETTQPWHNFPSHVKYGSGNSNSKK